MDYVLLYMTAPSEDEAMRIAEALATEHLAACANVLAPMASVFLWEGETQRETEWPVIAKTRRDLITDVVTRVRDLHSYETPCVVAVPVVGGDSDFLSWIGAVTRSA